MSKKQLHETLEHSHGSCVSYTVGFILSLLLTVLAFGAVMQAWFDSTAMTIIFITLLALGQLFVQLVLFLHFNTESRPYWNLSAFCFAILIVFVIVAASIWIMYHLNLNMM